MGYAFEVQDARCVVQAIRDAVLEAMILEQVKSGCINLL